MSETDLYRVSLDFETGKKGAASLTLALTVDTVHQTLNGKASGTRLDGTQNPMSYTAIVAGVYHATGLGKITKVASVQGQALVTAKPPLIGAYLAPFSAEFSVDDSWTGIGSFRIGDEVHEAKVEQAELPVLVD